MAQPAYIKLPRGDDDHVGASSQRQMFGQFGSHWHSEDRRDPTSTSLDRRDVANLELSVVNDDASEAGRRQPIREAHVSQAPAGHERVRAFSEIHGYRNLRLGKRALSVLYERFEVAGIHILDGAGAGAIQNGGRNTPAGINECTNLLFDDIRTLTPEYDIQSSDRQARDQECGTQRESDDRHHLPTDEPPCAPESSAGSRPTKGPRGFGRFSGQLWQRTIARRRNQFVRRFQGSCPKIAQRISCELSKHLVVPIIRFQRCWTDLNRRDAPAVDVDFRSGDR